MASFIGCGRCCRYLGFPPFAPDKHGRVYKGVYLDTLEDLPEDLRRKRDALLRSVVDGREPDRAKYYMTCSWFDEQTGRCRHYEHRPQICREYDCRRRDDCTITTWQIHGAETEGVLDQ